MGDAACWLDEVCAACGRVRGDGHRDWCSAAGSDPGDEAEKAVTPPSVATDTDDTSQATERPTQP